MAPQILPIDSPFVQMRKSSAMERGATEVLMNILSNSVLLDPGEAHSLVYRVEGVQDITKLSNPCNLGYIEFCWCMVMGKTKSRIYNLPPRSSSSLYGLNIKRCEPICHCEGENGSILSEPVILRPDARHDLEENVSGGCGLKIIVYSLLSPHLTVKTATQHICSSCLHNIKYARQP